MRQLTLALLVMLAAPFALRAQSPYLVKDINSSTAAGAVSSTPNNFFRFGSRIFFAASVQGSGSELWSTDGTEAGTALVAEIGAGSASSSPSHFGILNGKLIFNAVDSRYGNELWTSDGTAAGTRLLADIRTGTAASFPGERIVYGNQMVFAANDGVDGNELWITDGTPAGTRFLKDVLPGAGSSDPSSFVLFHDSIYFCATNGLWKTDGTEAGTVQVKADVYALGLVVAGSQMFFAGASTATGNELWVSDGTAGGTRMVTETNPGPSDSVLYQSSLTALGDRVLFDGIDSQHGTELWISDGTAAGTHVVRDIYAGTGGSYPGRPVVTDAGVAFFAANSETAGQELWKTDGTESGTVLVRDIVPGPGSGGASSIVSSGATVYFIASNGLWESDGTTSGTKPVQTGDAVVPLASYGLTVIDGVVYFAGANRLNGYEPWKSDGTAAGTSMIRNLARDAAPSSNPINLIAAGDWIYFNAWDGSGTDSFANSTWRSDGTDDGTLRIGAFFGENPSASGHSLYFSRSNAGWTSNGTPEGTAPFFVKGVPGQAFFAFQNGSTLFVYGPDALLYAVGSNSVPEALGVGGYRFINQAGRTLFISSAGLQITDGTRAGTYAIGPPISGQVTGMVSMAGSTYYAVQNSNGTSTLWRNDGTFESNVLVKNLTTDVSVLTAADRRLFFLSGGQLWVSDGTEAGTQAVTSGTTYLSKFAVAGSRAIFAEADAANGLEPWVSDGTVGGTQLLRDIWPGTFGSFPTDLTSVRGSVCFSAADDLRGNEVWMTDGTPEGTKLAAEIEPGFNGSFPHQYVEAGDRLFFTATTAATGTELWALPLSTAPRLTANDTRIAEGNSGSTTARFTLTLSAPATQPVTVDYSTSDGTATSGSDYEAASGSLTFAAGETSKTIDVRVLGDVKAESNESFLLTLRNPVGATLQNASAVAIIDDDDQVTDLGLSLDFSSYSNFEVAVNATNNGPRTATNIHVTHTATPADDASSCEAGCFGTPAPLNAGAKERVFQYRWFGFQQYLTTTATIHERDTQPSNNSVGWMTNTNLAMDALFLTPGSQANVWVIAYNTTSVSITSSNPAVLSVPSTLTVTGGQPATFVAHGVSAGSAIIRVVTPSATVGTLEIDVVPSGTMPRWPGAILAYPGNGGVAFDSPLRFSILTHATAPYTGAMPTGIVTVSANGHELGRVTINPDVRQQDLNYYLPDFGNNTIRFDYPGDANFLPVSTTSTVQVTTGHATILGGAERIGTAARVHVRVTGSPSGAPSGTITISEPGVIAAKTVTLTPGAPGESQADIDLTNVSAAPHTLVVTYAGDARYAPSSQSIRMTDARLRSVKR